jgi:hypothetical protein
LRQIDPHTELARPLPRNGAVVRDVRNARPLSSALAKARMLAEREAENECTLRRLANNERAAHPRRGRSIAIARHRARRVVIAYRGSDGAITQLAAWRDSARKLVKRRLIQLVQHIIELCARRNIDGEPASEPVSQGLYQQRSIALANSLACSGLTLFQFEIFHGEPLSITINPSTFVRQPRFRGGMEPAASVSAPSCEQAAHLRFCQLAPRINPAPIATVSAASG